MAVISQQTLAGLGWAALAITIWSGSLVMLRLGVTTSLNIFDLTALRFGVAALILAPVAWRRGIGTEQLKSSGLAAMVIAFGAPYVLLISLAMKTAPASAAGVINPGVMALGSVLLGVVIFGDKTGLTRFTGLLMTVAGLILFTLSRGTFTFGHLILIGTGLMWASYAIIVRRAAVPAINATAIVALGSALVFLPVYLTALPKQVFSAPITDVLVQAGFQGILVSVVAIYAFTRSAELLGSAAGATLPALIPVVTLGIGVIALHEPAGPQQILSALLITLGLTLILVGPQITRWLVAFVSNDPFNLR